ncbi:MAG: hypothetical protein RI885_2021 [Actinomycetota bacterium]
MTSTGFAVLDFETTGLWPDRQHRVVELSIVHLDQAGTIEGAWETLVDPGHDLGADRVHGVAPHEFLAAPTFAEIAGDVMALLGGRTLVVHNAGFELRFLAAELERLGHRLQIEPEDLICTLRLAQRFAPEAGRSVVDCLDQFEIQVDDAHESLADALATAQLLEAYLTAHPDDEVWAARAARAVAVAWPTIRTSGAPWVPRSRVFASPRGFLERTVAGMSHSRLAGDHDFREVDYLGTLDKAFSDGLVSVRNADELTELARDIGLDSFARDILHRRYFANLVAVAWSDSELSDAQRAEFLQVARVLDLPKSFVARAIPGMAPMVQLSTRRTATLPIRQLQLAG